MLAISEAIHRRFTYRQQVTGVDSPIDHALESGEGVCQDFAHVMLACVRRRGIPGRYVSGYLFHGSDDTSADGATHAWIEAFLPGLGWVGFDPTNNVIAGTRHIRVAIGRDYADVPPTKGVFRGRSANELAVAVQVSLADTAVLTRELMPVMTWTTPETTTASLTGTSISSSSSSSSSSRDGSGQRLRTLPVCRSRRPRCCWIAGLAPRSHARRGRPLTCGRCSRRLAAPRRPHGRRRALG